MNRQANPIRVSICCAILVLAAASCAVVVTNDPSSNPFAGTWTDTVSATESYTYVYNADMTFEYTWVTASMTVKYRGSYSYDSAALSYQEIVTSQNNGAGWTDGGWTTNYSYAINGSTLNFDDGSGYTPSFTKS